MKEDQQLYEEMRGAVDALNTQTVKALKRAQTFYAEGMRDIMVMTKKRSKSVEAQVALSDYIGNNLISWPYPTPDFKPVDEPTHKLKDYKG